jgi:hypothetical protein
MCLDGDKKLRPRTILDRVGMTQRGQMFIARKTVTIFDPGAGRTRQTINRYATHYGVG